MENIANTEEGSPAEQAVSGPPEPSKKSVRDSLWELYKGMSHFAIQNRRMMYIPVFEGVEEATKMLTSLDVYRRAKIVKVTHDKVLHTLRKTVVADGKELLIPVHAMNPSVTARVRIPEDYDVEKEEEAGNVRSPFLGFGNTQYKEFVRVEDENPPHIDLVVLPALAVSETGFYLGRGDGYNDLEFAVMAHHKYVNSSTPVVALVHDSQVTNIPQELMENHDLHVDFIVTPTRVIDCGKHEKNVLFHWPRLTFRRVLRLGVLSRIYKSAEAESGEKIQLAPFKYYTRKPKYATKEGEDGDVGREFTRPARRGFGRGGGRGRSFRRNNFGGGRPRRPLVDDEGEEGVSEERNQTNDGTQQSPRRAAEGGPRRFDRRFRRYAPRSRKSEDGREDERQKTPYPRKANRRRFDSAIYVGLIPRDVRVSEFKGVMRDYTKNTEGVFVKPNTILWRGTGYALLFFSNSSAAGDALERLKGLSLNGTSCMVEPSKNRWNVAAPDDSTPVIETAA